MDGFLAGFVGGLTALGAVVTVIAGLLALLGGQRESAFDPEDLHEKI